MKTISKILLVMLLTIFATTHTAVSNSLSPFDMNLDASQGTAGSDDIFVEVNSLEGFEDKAAEFVVPAWLEILTLISPANYPLTTFLSQKSLDNIKGMALAEARNGGKHSDILNKVDDNNTRFNPNYAVKKDKMANYKNFKEHQISNYKLNWGEIAILPMQDVVSTAVTGGTTSVTIPVDNVDMWKVTHTLRVQDLSFNNGTDNDGKPVVLYVGSVDSANNQIVAYSYLDDGSENIPAIPANSRLTRQGVASANDAVKNDAITQAPTSDYNYGQKFITSVVYENYLQMTELFSNYSFSLVTNLALQDFRYGQEFSFMFGLRGAATLPQPDGTTKMVRFTGGLIDYVDQVITYGTGSGDTTITETDIVDFTKTMRVGNNGSDTRFLWAGSEMIASLNKGVMNDSTRFVQKEYNTVYGLSFTSLYSFFGTINVSYAPLMDQTEYTDRGWLLDMDFIDKAVFQPFRETQTDLVKLRISDGKSIDMVENCLLVVQNRDTHFEIRPKA